MPLLLAGVDDLRRSFPNAAEAPIQVAWIEEQYTADEPLTLNLITLLLFEHGVHRSVDQVSRDLAILPEEPEFK